MKDVIFSKHAEQKVTLRNISKEKITSTIYEQKDVVPTRGNSKICHGYVDDKLLRIVFREEESQYIIITAYLTDKKRY